MRPTPLIPFFAAAIPTAATCLPVRSWLVRREGFDRPNERSSHSVPTPRGGGIACALGAVAGSTVSRLCGRGPSSAWLVSSSVLGGVGWLDDVRGLAPLPRLGTQVVVGAATGASAGGMLGTAFGAMALPAIVNAFNFMDGINGISGGTAASWGVSVGSDSRLADSQRLQGLLTAGMGVGFLPYNAPKASMFLGDVGSYLFGAGIAVTVIESALSEEQLKFSKCMVAIGPLVPYLADTGMTILQRLIRHESVTEAHREHVYQRLVHEIGLEHWMVSSLMAIASLGCGIACRSQSRAYTVIPIAIAYLVSPYALRRFRASST